MVSITVAMKVLLGGVGELMYDDRTAGFGADALLKDLDEYPQVSHPHKEKPECVHLYFNPRRLADRSFNGSTIRSPNSVKLQ